MVSNLDNNWILKMDTDNIPIFLAEQWLTEDLDLVFAYCAVIEEKKNFWLKKLGALPGEDCFKLYCNS